MIVGDRVKKVEGEVFKRERFQNLSINISVKEVREEGGNLVIDYIYEARYEPEKAYLKIEGEVFDKEEKNKRKEILEKWQKDKVLPDDYLGYLMTAINFICSAHGTLLARILGYTPPLVPPRIKRS